MTPEAWNKLSLQSPNLFGGGGAAYSKQDLLAACQGLREWKTAYMEYHYCGDLAQRHKVYAGLMSDSFDIAEIVDWWKLSKKHVGKINKMCELAVIELEYKDAKQRKKEKRKFQSMTDKKRAKYIGVSERSWYRGYNRIYARILSIPSYWEHEVLKTVGRRLKMAE